MFRTNDNSNCRPFKRHKFRNWSNYKYFQSYGCDRIIPRACSFTITVIDNELPQIICPAGITANVTTNTCATNVTYSTPTGTDNCSGQTTIQTAGLASGSSFPTGTTTNIFRLRMHQIILRAVHSQLQLLIIRLRKLFVL